MEELNRFQKTFIIREFADSIKEEIKDAILLTNKKVLTTKECAKYLGVSLSCLYKWTMNKQIPHYKGPNFKMCYFEREEIEKWAMSNKVDVEF